MKSIFNWTQTKNNKPSLDYNSKSKHKFLRKKIINFNNKKKSIVDSLLLKSIIAAGLIQIRVEDRGEVKIKKRKAKNKREIKKKRKKKRREEEEVRMVRV